MSATARTTASEPPIRFRTSRRAQSESPSPPDHPYSYDVLGPASERLGVCG